DQAAGGVCADAARGKRDAAPAGVWVHHRSEPDGFFAEGPGAERGGVFVSVGAADRERADGIGKDLDAVRDAGSADETRCEGDESGGPAQSGAAGGGEDEGE